MSDHPGTGKDSNTETPTRRSFLKAVGKKAAYITPIVMTMSAKTALAGASKPFDSTCGDTGSPCVVDGDCCAGLTCTGMTCM